MEGLDADPHGIEIVAVRDVAEVVVEEQLLHADEVVVAMGRLARLDEQHAAFGHVDEIVVDGEGGAVLDVRRLVGGVALQQRRADDEGLREDEAFALAEYVQPVRIGSGLHADGNRKAARFDHRVADCVDDEEPFVRALQPQELGRAALGAAIGRLLPDRHRRLAHLAAALLLLGRGDADRAIALVGVLVVGIPPVLLHHAQRFDQAPAIGHGQLVGGKGLRRRGAHGAHIGLVDPFGQVGIVAGAAAAIDQFGIDRVGLPFLHGAEAPRGGLRLRLPGHAAAALVRLLLGFGRRHGAPVDPRLGLHGLGRKLGLRRQRGGTLDSSGLRLRDHDRGKDEGHRHAYSPSQTFCCAVSRKGANGQFT